MNPGALIIDSKDNVATAVRAINKGERLSLRLEGRKIGLEVRQDLALGHKLALKTIAQGEAVVKYGEVIGLATRAIRPGEHVHVHNVEGRKGRGDR
jgi:altronate dehydratase small subunit